MPFLELNRLSVSYSNTPVLRDINLYVERGEIVTLVGANGAGKSTLVKAISGLVRSQTGEILVNGEPIQRLPPSARLRLGIAHVPEGRQIFSGMTVMENLRLGAHASPADAIAERFETVWRLFPILKARQAELAGNFSGGQQQMLAIARGLMSGPRILLLDEPSLGVAPLLVAEIFKLIRTLRDRGITTILAEQNARQALAIADRAYVFENGRVALSGSSKDLLDSPEVAGRYLGIGSGTAVSEMTSAKLAERLRTALSVVA